MAIRKVISRSIEDNTVAAADFQGAVSSLSNAGNLTFSSTGQRILGDFSNSTLSNRLMFQSNTTNGNSIVSTLPNGTATTSAIQLFNNSDPTNASQADLRVTGSTDVRLSSTSAGSGTYLPLTMYTNGSERLRIDTSGRLLVGTSSTTTSSSQSGEIYSTGATGFLMTNTTAANYGLSVKNEGTSGTRNLIQFLEGTGGGTSRANISLDGSNNLTVTPANSFYVTKSSVGTVARFTGSGDGGRGLAFTSADNGEFLGAIWDYNVLSGSGIQKWSINSTERMRIKSSGAIQASKNGVYKTWSGNIEGHQFRLQDTDMVTLTAEANNASYTTTVIRSLCDTTASSAYTFLTCTSGNLGDDEFRLRGDGQAYADGSWNAGGADYAEYFEWVDGNLTNEDRRGYSVSLVGSKIKKAEINDNIIGVISGNPSVVGDSAWNSWTEKYLRDDFGTYLRESCEVWSWTDLEGLEHSYEFDKVPNGIIVPEDKTIVTQDRQILNPEYDASQEYTAREQRREWGCVGLMGKLRVRKGQPIGDRWIKMRDISENVEEWLVR
jgi:hypothetical protein